MNPALLQPSRPDKHLCRSTFVCGHLCLSGHVGMHFELVQCVCREQQSFLPDHKCPGQQAASEGGQVDLWISHRLSVSGWWVH